MTITIKYEFAYLFLIYLFRFYLDLFLRLTQPLELCVTKYFGQRVLLNYEFSISGPVAYSDAVSLPGPKLVIKNKTKKQVLVWESYPCRSTTHLTISITTVLSSAFTESVTTSIICGACQSLVVRTLAVCSDVIIEKLIENITSTTPNHKHKP